MWGLAEWPREPFAALGRAREHREPCQRSGRIERRLLGAFVARPGACAAAPGVLAESVSGLLEAAVDLLRECRFGERSAQLASHERVGRVARRAEHITPLVFADHLEEPWRCGASEFEVVIV